MSKATFEVTESKIYCRQSLGLQIASGLFALLLVALCLYLFYAFWPAPGSLSERSPADILRNPTPFLLLPLLVLCGPTLLLLHYAGPADLIVDLNQRTYRFRRGFPLLASWQNGPLEDIADLRVKTVTSSSTTSSQLLLDWKNTQAAPWSLGDGSVSSRRPVQMRVSQDAGRVREEAEQLARKMGVPVQESVPGWEQARQNAQIWLVLMPVALFFMISSLPDLVVAQSLKTEGVNAVGQVTALRRGKSDVVRYAYRVNGHVFNGRDSVPWSVFSSLEVGSSLAISYLPAYPHTSAIASAENGSSGSNRNLYLRLAVITVLIALITGRVLLRRRSRSQ